MLGYVYMKGKHMKDNELVTYQVKVDKEKWKTFKGCSYILGFDTVNDCLNHLIDDCVKRVKNGD